MKQVLIKITPESYDAAKQVAKNEGFACVGTMLSVEVNARYAKEAKKLAKDSTKETGDDKTNDAL